MKVVVCAVLVAAFLCVGAKAATNYVRLSYKGVVCSGDPTMICQRADATQDRVYFTHDSIYVKQISPPKVLFVRRDQNVNENFIPASTPAGTIYSAGILCGPNASFGGVTCSLINKQGYKFNFSMHKIVVLNVAGAAVFTKTIP